MEKITFLGDIMIEPPVLKAAKQRDGSYNFDGVFNRVQELLSKSDYVIGNLETPLAGKEAGYTRNHLGFNAPDSYVDACLKAGIKMVSTANNHTFDRGYDGMIRTIKVLDEKGMGHAGSYLPGQERPEAFYFQVGDTKCAVICYTYGTNYGGSGGRYLAEGEYAGTVNLLRPQNLSYYMPGVLRGSDWVDKLYKKLQPNVNPSDDIKGNFKKFMGMTCTYSRADDNIQPEKTAAYIEQMQSDIRTAFQLQERNHPAGKIMVAGTSCRMVSFPTFEREIAQNGLEIVEKGLTEAMPDFNSLLYAVVKRA